MGLFIWITTYTTTVKRLINHHCKCERCGAEFGFQFEYHHKGTGTAMYGLGSATAKQRSASRAHSEFEAAISKVHPHFPCPECGWYQSFMNDYYRSERWADGYSYCLLASAVGIIVFIGASVDSLSDSGWRGLVAEVLLSPLFLSALLFPFGLLGIVAWVRRSSDLNRTAPCQITYPLTEEAQHNQSKVL